MTIKLHFHGATRTVTGSCYLLETDHAKILVDCGLFQGNKTISELNYRPFPFHPDAITALILTHAHIDHSGLIPKLTKGGFKGRIYCTQASVDLCSVMLPDSGFIQESETKRLNKRNRKRGTDEIEPIYTADDAVKSLAHFQGVAYRSWVDVGAGIKVRWWNAGHLLGSASLEVEVERKDQSPLRILFSGDLGPKYKMLEPDPEAPSGFDFIICESTYGGHDRADLDEEGRREVLARAVNPAAVRNGALLIPSFAVERTQEIVTDLAMLMERQSIPQAPIFIDSPLANKATNIFKKYSRSLDHADDLNRAFNAPFVRAIESVEESKSLSRFGGFHVIVAASGMCEAGRIRHHLKNHLWEASTTVLLAGFQARGSLGGMLADGAKRVIIQGEEIEVRATITKLEDYSGHADGPELVTWLKERLPVTKTIFLTHGEEQGQLALEKDIAALVAYADCIRRPALDDVYDLLADECALLVSESHPRIDPHAVAQLDSHADFSNIILDIRDKIEKAADEKARAVIVRRLRRALEDEEN